MAACSETTGLDDEVGACEVVPGAVCRDQDLRSVSLVAADLTGVDFSGSDLSKADLRDANLTGAKLVGSVLAGTNFGGANLKNADLTNAFMFGTNLTDADLTGAITAGMQRCNVTEPDGATRPARSSTPRAGRSRVPEARPGPADPGLDPTVGPPKIEYFRLAKPERCMNDAAGTGIDVEWSTRTRRASTSPSTASGSTGPRSRRGPSGFPFGCDGKPHTSDAGIRGTNQPECVVHRPPHRTPRRRPADECPDGDALAGPASSVEQAPGRVLVEVLVPVAALRRLHARRAAAVARALRDQLGRGARCGAASPANASSAIPAPPG